MTSRGSLFPGTTTTTFTITREQLNAFHRIDRTMYSRLVQVIGRDQAESMQVMALWLWLERHSGLGRNLIQKLLTYPDPFVNMLSQESVACLRCVENDSVPVSEFLRDENNFPMMHGVLGGGINLFYFKENRVPIILGVEKIMKEVCFRVFDDIFLRAQSGAVYPLYGQPRGGDAIGGDEMGDVILWEGVPLGDEEVQEMIGEVGPDERIIFLTFSKGYPTSEFEVRDFFTRRYGNIIEAIHMQEVLPEDQPLYARLVVHSASVVDVVLERQNKAKFTINGKHVWARKYVRKIHQTN